MICLEEGLEFMNTKNQLNWLGKIFQKAKHLGLEATKKWYDRKIAENKIENQQFFKDKLKALTGNNGQTLFDIILEIISEQKHIEFEI